MIAHARGEGRGGGGGGENPLCNCGHEMGVTKVNQLVYMKDLQVCMQNVLLNFKSS